MTVELKNGQIVGIVSPDPFPGCDLEVKIAKVPGSGKLNDLISDGDPNSAVVGERYLKKDGIQYTFPELAPVLCPESTEKNTN